LKSAPLGILLVAGKLTHQENYCQQFRKDPRCQLIAVTDEPDISPERRYWNRALATELEIPYLPDLDEALARDDVQITSVCAEPERRGRILVKCARAGKHLYIDKPMTPYLATANEVVNLVNEMGVRSQMFSFIHQPWVQRARQIVEAGVIGQLVALHADCVFAKGPAGSAQLGRHRQSQFPPPQYTFVDSKAELYAMGVYALGLVQWLTQRAVITVFGHTANYFFEAHQRNGVEDFGFLSLTIEEGITATITGGRMGWSSHGGAGVNQVYLIGSEGTLLIDAYRPRLEVYDAGPPWTAPKIHPLDPMGFWRSTQQAVNTQPKRVFTPFSQPTPAKSDESHFIDCIIEERESEMNARQAAKLTEILVAGYKSAATGTVVSIPLP
jgi:myo-inositol 2-dehydrogenase/D-chiro-inositol 1-dehydrogenase